MAPVARYASYWNLPILSPGGFAHTFGKNKHILDSHFATLTRIGVTFNTLAQCVIEVTRNYGYAWVKIIYVQAGHANVMPKFCYLAASSIIASSKEENLAYDFHIYIPENHDIGNMLRKEVGNELAGK